MWVKASLWKKPEVRGGFMLTEMPNTLCYKPDGDSKWNLSLSPFCKWIPWPTKAIWASFDGLKNSLMQYFAGSSGWLNTYPITMKWTEGEFYAVGVGELPRILFGRGRGKLRHTRLAIRNGLKPGWQKMSEKTFMADTKERAWGLL